MKEVTTVEESKIRLTTVRLKVDRNSWVMIFMRQFPYQAESKAVIQKCIQDSKPEVPYIFFTLPVRLFTVISIQWPEP